MAIRYYRSPLELVEYKALREAQWASTVEVLSVSLSCSYRCSYIAATERITPWSLVRIQCSMNDLNREVRNVRYLSTVDTHGMRKRLPKKSVNIVVNKRGSDRRCATRPFDPLLDVHVISRVLHARSRCSLVRMREIRRKWWCFSQKRRLPEKQSLAGVHKLVSGDRPSEIYILASTRAEKEIKDVARNVEGRTR